MQPKSTNIIEIIFPIRSKLFVETVCMDQEVKVVFTLYSLKKPNES